MRSTVSVHSTIEASARNSHARLLAFLAARTGDLDGAEDALADAYEAAVRHWPHVGVPKNPEAWLFTAARRRLIDGARHQRAHENAIAQLSAHVADTQQAESAAFPDERLKLLFVCAHPAIDPMVRTPLMLQTVLKLDAARIASVFLIQPATMGQRLSRAKTKIRDARIRFEVPEPSQLAARLEAVLDAVYGAFGTAWDDLVGADRRRLGLADEAIQLGRLLVELLPGEPEALGLLALMLHCEARRPSRRGTLGEYVPLLEQDVTGWSRALMSEAETLLSAAARVGRIGRFQLEAAIQSAHAQRALTGTVDWESVALLYEGLVRCSPTIGAQVGRAAAIAQAYGPARAWAALQKLPREVVDGYQPYWALRADLLRREGRRAEADASYARAIELCEDDATRRFLLAQMHADAVSVAEWMRQGTGG
jgi:predicted RNA polymerase sigma factor